MKQNKIYSVLSFFSLLFFGLNAGFSQLVVDETTDAAEAVEAFLLGSGLEIFNLTFSGDADQIGTFSSENSNLPLLEGVILATGSCSNVIGPNNSGSSTTGGGNFGQNDPDLDLISAFNTNDAAVVEFDVIPSGEFISFRYCFGSEEYNEYVCGSVNDAFGFFLSGPGINGEFSNNAINLAIIPETDGTPVTINSVNNGNVGSGGIASNCAQVDPNWMNNTEYYVDNANNGDANATQLDGFTVVFVAEAAVQCGQTYHIKIAIADAGDTAFDSAVFLEAGSLQATNPNPFTSGCSDDDLPWSHDCNVDNCDSWVFGNGADINGAPWEGIDLNFECSTEGPAGPYNQWAGGTGDFTAAPPMNSTTGTNGLLIVDSDLFGADANYSAAWIENSWVQTAEPINCSATEFIRMSFQTRYRCWDNGSSDDSEKCLVEISRDGVNWPDISTFSEADGTVNYGDGVLVPSRWEVFPGYETGSETDNPSFIDLDLSSAAGGQEQVWIRFRWSATWGYSWEIDDILLQEAPMNDLRVESYVSTTDYANTGMYELGAIPIGQLTNYQAGVMVKNIGINPQSGVQLNLSVDGTTIGTSPFYSLDYDQEQTLQAAYALDGLDLGPHTLEFEVSADAADDYPENNSATRTIEITEHQLGRDNGSMTGLFPSDGTDDFIALNPFGIYEDATIYAIDVAIASGSESGTPIVAHLFDASDGNFLTDQYGGLMTSTYELDLDGALTNEGNETEITWYTLVFEDPIAVSAGQSIAAGFEHYGGSNVQIWESQYTFDQTSFTYGPFGSGSAYDWYYTNEVPMVRLNFNPNAVNSGAGCTDPQACNYNPNSVQDNGSCEYETCAGCLDESACNFDPDATISSPELCTYPGCLDSSATNYDPSAGCYGPCIYLTYDCASIGESAWGNEAMGLFPEWQGAMHGVAWEGEWVFNIPLSIVEPNSGVTYSVHHVNWTSVEGLPLWLDEADYTLGELAAESQHCIPANGTPSESGWHEITSTGEVFISIFGQPFSIGEQSFSAWLEVVDNPNPIPGCTYATAQNFVAFATLDDGSCEFAGCTDPEAGNFNPLATIDDGSCGEACDPSSDSICETDIDNDGTVSVTDLLLLLGDFGTTCTE